MVYIRPICSNCNEYFEYIKPPNRVQAHSFCSKECCAEYHYFKSEMTRNQFYILNKIATDKYGIAAFKYDKALLSMAHCITPLVEIIGHIDEITVLCGMTDRGKYWYQLKAGIRA